MILSEILVLCLVIACAAALALLVMYLSQRGRRLALEAEVQSLAGQLHTEETLARERTAALAQAEERLSAAFARLAHDSLSQNSQSFLRLAQENLGRHQEKAKAELTEREKAVADLVKPIQEALQKTQQQIGEIEKARHDAFGSIRTQLLTMTTDQQQLQQETRNLVNALRRPQVRGQWGEMTLRRVAELAGMVEHCDFTEQETVATDTGSIRPDMIVRLPERGVLIVDVKTPLDAYLEAVEAQTDQARNVALQRHARNVLDRVRELASKAYWSQFRTSPEFVILFIPGEQFLSAALTENPGLLEEALRQKVVLATPTSLVALLKAIAYGWREVSLAKNAEEVRKLAVELYDRLLPFTGHLGRLGRQLEGAVKAFNAAVGSLEGKVLPSARRLVELGIPGKEGLENPAMVETSVRGLVTAGSPQLPSTGGPELTDPEPDDSAEPDDLARPH
jgi:DNA recombination protein RmuC